MNPSNVFVRPLPAIFNASNGICAFLLQQCQGPVNVAAIQPVVVDAQGIFKVLNSVMPSAWNKYGLPSLLQALHCRKTHSSGPCSLPGDAHHD